MNAADICNLALGRIGHGASSPIQSIDPGVDDSEAARACARSFDLAMRAVLREYRWSWAQASVELAVTAQAVPGFTYCYAYPAECSFLHGLSESSTDPGRNPIWRWPYRILASTDGQSRVIATELSGAWAHYTRTIAKGNIAREKYQATSVTSPLQVAKFTVDMVQLFAVETIIMALVRNGLPDDEEDDGAADDWLWYLSKEVGLGSLATIPLLSQLATEGRGYTSQGVMERGWATLTDATGAWFDGELDRKDLKQAVLVSGTMAGVPSSQINTTADALWRVHDGEDVSPMDFLTRSDKPRD